MNTSEIRNQEIKVKVKLTESVSDAIARYMKRNGFLPCDWVDGKGITHFCFTGNGYRELWVSSQLFHNNVCTFSLAGDR